MMRLALIILVWLTMTVTASAQVVGRLFYNEKWELVSKDSAVYFRVGIIDTANQIFAGAVRDFTKDGKPVMTGNYLGGQKNGLFTTLYRNASKESEGTYQNNLRVGVWRHFYSNGQIKNSIDFGQDGYIHSLSYFDSLGNNLLHDGNGPWSFDFLAVGGTPTTIQGMYRNSQMDGDWNCSDTHGMIWCSSTFAMGKFISGFLITDENFKLSLEESLISVAPESSKYWMTERFLPGPGINGTDYPYLTLFRTRALKEPSPEKDMVYTIVELSGHPKGGMTAFYNEVSRLMKYPAEAKKKHVEGRVFLEFVINKDGVLSDIRVIRGLGAGCDEEAIRVLQQSQEMVPWMPGVQRRIRVKQRYTLPIIFKLR